jgi:serine/threonine-protein kinase
MLAGQPPFMAQSLTELLRAHLLEPVPRLAELRPDLIGVDALQAVIDRALAKQADERFLDAGEMLRALLAISLPAQTAPDEAVTGRMVSSAQAPAQRRPQEARTPSRPADPLAPPQQAFAQPAAWPQHTPLSSSTAPALRVGGGGAPSAGTAPALRVGAAAPSPSDPLARPRSNGWVLLVLAATVCAVVGWLLR